MLLSETAGQRDLSNTSRWPEYVLLKSSVTHSGLWMENQPLCHAITVCHFSLLMSSDPLSLSSFYFFCGHSHDPRCKCSLSTMSASSVPADSFPWALTHSNHLIALSDIFVLPTRAKVIAVFVHFVGQRNWALVLRCLAQHYFAHLCEDLGMRLKFRLFDFEKSWFLSVNVLIFSSLWWNTRKIKLKKNNFS